MTVFIRQSDPDDFRVLQVVEYSDTLSWEVSRKAREEGLPLTDNHRPMPRTYAGSIIVSETPPAGAPETGLLHVLSVIEWLEGLTGEFIEIRPDGRFPLQNMLIENLPRREIPEKAARFDVAFVESEIARSRFTDQVASIRRGRVSVSGTGRDDKEDTGNGAGTRVSIAEGAIRGVKSFLGVGGG